MENEILYKYTLQGYYVFKTKILLWELEKLVLPEHPVKPNTLAGSLQVARIKQVPAAVLQHV